MISLFFIGCTKLKTSVTEDALCILSVFNHGHFRIAKCNINYLKYHLVD